MKIEQALEKLHVMYPGKHIIVCGVVSGGDGMSVSASYTIDHAVPIRITGKTLDECFSKLAEWEKKK